MTAQDAERLEMGLNKEFFILPSDTSFFSDYCCNIEVTEGNVRHYRKERLFYFKPH